LRGKIQPGLEKRAGEALSNVPGLWNLWQKIAPLHPRLQQPLQGAALPPQASRFFSRKRGISVQHLTIAGLEWIAREDGGKSRLPADHKMAMSIP
jgi:hypothetical protein